MARRRNDGPLDLAQPWPQVVNDFHCQLDITDHNKPSDVCNVWDDRIGRGDLSAGVVSASGWLLLPQPPASQPKERGVTVWTRDCYNCNKSYESLSPFGRFCSDACRQADYRRRKSEGKKIIKRNRKPQDTRNDKKRTASHDKP